MKKPQVPFPEEGDRLLFIRFSSLGDVLLALGIAKALKARFPALHLTWLAQAEYEGLLRMQPYVDDVLPWDIARGKLTVFSLISRVRRGHFRFLYSVHANDRSALISAFSGIPVRIGFHKNLAFAYGHSLAEAGQTWQLPRIAEGNAPLVVPEEQRARLSEKLPAQKRRFLFCAIGASKPFKRWPSSSWAAFLEKAGEDGLVPVLVGNGPEEECMADEIASSCSADVVNLVGKLSLEEVCALAVSSELAVGGDTGPIHLARMTGIPCIGLFAVNDPARYGHKGKNLFALVSENPFEIYPESPPKGFPLASIPPENAVSLMRKLLGPKREGARKGTL
jgi:ADP-heptose:LPS heptosyltransferase